MKYKRLKVAQSIRMKQILPSNWERLRINSEN